jgi:hypothetical protein
MMRPTTCRWLCPKDELRPSGHMIRIIRAIRVPSVTPLKKGQFEIFLLKKWEEIIENDPEIPSVVQENAENRLQSGRKFVAFRESRVFSVESSVQSVQSVSHLHPRAIIGRLFSPRIRLLGMRSKVASSASSTLSKRSNTASSAILPSRRAKGAPKQ